MKQGFWQALTVFSFAVISTTASLSLAESVVMGAKTIQLRSLSKDVAMGDMVASYSTYCSYSKGLFWPERTSCGGSKVTLPVSAQGVIQLPAMPMASGFKGAKLDNYEISLSVHPKTPAPGMPNYFLVLTARGEEDLQAFANFNEVINIARIHGGEMDLTVERRGLLGEEPARVPNSRLMVVTGLVRTGLLIPPPLLISSFNSNIQSYENRVFTNGMDADTELQDLKRVVIPTMYLAFTGNPNEVRISVSVSYTITTDPVHQPSYQAEAVGLVDEDFVRRNSRLDLKLKEAP